MSFYDNFVFQCTKINKKPSVVAQELGLAKSSVSHWKARGAAPRDVMKHKIADYFGCSIFDLTDEVEQKEKPAPESGNELEILDKIIDNMSREELLDFISKATDMLRNK